jgi:hypothetical protein
VHGSVARGPASVESTARDEGVAAVTALTLHVDRHTCLGKRERRLGCS